MKKTKKIKWLNILSLLILVISIITLIISSLNIFNWKKDSNNIKEQIENIQEIVNIEEGIDNENTEIINQEEIPEASPYWDYINMNMIYVDFNELKQINKDVIGWIQVNGTNINYPFVGTSDNNYYLTHSLDKSYNRGGWIFLDYRNKKDLNNKNTIIYGHGRQDQTMFGSLKKIFKNGWLNDTNNFVIKLSTEKENTLWQVFSIYHIPVTSDYLKTEFNNDNDFLEFSNMLIKRSIYDFKTSVSKNDQILTLSTCYNDTERMAIHAKLIKKESR